MAENSDQTLHFNEYFKVIRNRLWVIFTIFLLTVLSGTYVTNEVIQKKYTASAQIQIGPDKDPSVPTFVGGAQNFDPTKFQSEFEVMQSPDVLMPIINKLGLDKVWAKRKFNGAVDTLPPEVALDYMKNVLKLDFKRGTNIIIIDVSSEIPQEAADIANALADFYKTKRDIELAQQTTRGSDSVREQIAQQQKIVDDKRALVDQLKADAEAHGVDINPTSAGTTERNERDLDSAKTALLTAKQDASARKTLLDKVINLPDDQFISTLIGLQRNIPEISNLRSEQFRIETDKQNLLKDGFEVNHPRVMSLQAEYDRRAQQIADLVAGQRRAMTTEAQIAESNIDVLQKEVDRLTQALNSGQTAYLEPYREALKDYEEQQGILNVFSMRLKELSIDKTLFESPVKIIARAEPPLTPSTPNKTLNMVISVVAGLFVGVVVAFLIEYLDTSVKTMADAESLLGLPVLTVIPNRGGPMPLSTDAARLPHAEGYRILRAKLDLKVQNGIGPSLSMLSGGPGEGKSTTIYNLAIICAQAGQSVILVDCDLRRPTLHDLVNLSNEFGLANYLRGEGDAVEYVQQTALPKLHVLTSGDMPMSEIGVLAGDKIRSMLEDLKQRYDLVLIDSPPVLGISDGSIIAREVDYVILVIQHRRYPREISLRAKRAIEEVHGNCVGMVLNCVAVKSDDSYYYYSSYGNYYKKADRNNKKRKDAAKTKSKSKTNGKHDEAVVATRKKELDSDEF